MSSGTQVVVLSSACALVRTSASHFLVLEDLEGNLLCFWELAVVFGLFVVFYFCCFVLVSNVSAAPVSPSHPSPVLSVV